MVLLLTALGCRGDISPDTADIIVPVETHIDEGLTLSDVQACSSPVAPSWVPLSEGLVGHTNPKADHLNGGGLYVGELSGDDLLDIMVFFDEDVSSLYHNTGESFVAVESGLPVLYGSPRFINIDKSEKDAILMSDLTLIRLSSEGEWRYLPAKGDTRNYSDLVVGDFDGNQHLDLFGVLSGDTDKHMRDVLFWDVDAGNFAYKTDALPSESASRKGFDGIAFDWDADGDDDVYVVNDMGSDFGGNVLWRNDGDRVFTDVSAECDCGIVMDGMGVSTGDYNGDGVVDLYLTATLKNVLLQGQSDGSFVDVTAATGANMLTDIEQMGWGSTWLDHDNDGDLDIIVLQGDLWGEGEQHTDTYDAPFHLMSQEDGSFRDVAPELGLSQTGSFRAVVAAELNGDGVLDFVITDVVREPLIFLSQGCTENAWIELILPEQSQVRVTAGGITQTATASRDPGFAASGPSRVWFGLGSADFIDEIIITDTEGSTLTATGIDARRRISLTE